MWDKVLDWVVLITVMILGWIALMYIYLALNDGVFIIWSCDC